MITDNVYRSTSRCLKKVSRLQKKERIWRLCFNKHIDIAFAVLLISCR